MISLCIINISWCFIIMNKWQCSSFFLAMLKWSTIEFLIFSYPTHPFLEMAERRGEDPWWCIAVASQLKKLLPYCWLRRLPGHVYSWFFLFLFLGFSTSFSIFEIWWVLFFELAELHIVICFIIANRAIYCWLFNQISEADSHLHWVISFEHFDQINRSCFPQTVHIQFSDAFFSAVMIHWNYFFGLDWDYFIGIELWVHFIDYFLFLLLVIWLKKGPN